MGEAWIVPHSPKSKAKTSHKNDAERPEPKAAAAGEGGDAVAPEPGGDWADQRRLPRLPSAGEERFHSALPVRRVGGGAPLGAADEPPAGGRPPLRHVDGGAAAVARRDLRHLRRAPVAAGPHQLPGVRAGPRLPHVGRPQPTWQDAIPRGGPQVGPHRAKRRPCPPRPHRPLPQPTLPGRRPPPPFPLRASLLAPQILLTWQRQMQVSAEHAGGGGVRHGVGPDNDRRAAGVLRGGAGEDGGDILGGGDGEEPEKIRCDARVPARRGPEGGEDVRRGVPVQEASGQGCGEALAFRDTALR